MINVLVVYTLLLFAASFTVWFAMSDVFFLAVVWSVIGTNTAMLWLHMNDGTVFSWVGFAVLNFNLVTVWFLFSSISSFFGLLQPSKSDSLVTAVLTMAMVAINVVGPLAVEVQFQVLSYISSLFGSV